MIKKNEKHLQSRGLADFQTSKGFTLAEVLITLGIIGVVAAMTIPTLMVDVNTKQWKTASNVFEKKLNEAMKSMNTAQVISGHPNTLSFVNELGKHFKINKICKNNELQNCFPETVYWGAGEATPEEVDMTTIKQASHFGLDDWGTELIGVQFANGVSGLVAYNPACSGDPYSNQFKGTGCISMLYDTSGDKNPNTSGKDLGNYGVISKLGRSDCFASIGNLCFAAPAFTPSAITYNECLSLKDELGIKHCGNYDSYGGDFWAGAVKTCGGVNKILTPSQLTELANYLYNTNNLPQTEDSPSGLTLDIEKASSLGINVNEYSNFKIWSNTEENETSSYFRYFMPTYTGYGTSGRTNDFQAICVQ